MGHSGDHGHSQSCSGHTLSSQLCWQGRVRSINRDTWVFYGPKKVSLEIVLYLSQFLVWTGTSVCQEDFLSLKEVS